MNQNEFHTPVYSAPANIPPARRQERSFTPPCCALKVLHESLLVPPTPSLEHTFTIASSLNLLHLASFSQTGNQYTETNCSTPYTFSLIQKKSWSVYEILSLLLFLHLASHHLFPLKSRTQYWRKGKLKLQNFLSQLNSTKVRVWLLLKGVSKPFLS